MLYVYYHYYYKPADYIIKYKINRHNYNFICNTLTR